MKQAEVLKRAHENAQNFEVADNSKPSVISIETNCEEQEEINEQCAVTTKQKKIEKVKSSTKTCYNCGYIHSPLKCPAKEQKCYNCSRIGHYSQCCKKPRKVALNSTLATIDNSLADSVIELKINNQIISALLYTGSSENFMDRKLAIKLGLKIEKYRGNVALADKKQSSKIGEKVRADVVFGNEQSL